MGRKAAFNVGPQLKYLRLSHNLTQQQLADKIDTSRTYISDIEAGRDTPSLKLLAKMAQAYNVTMADIVKGAEDNK